MSCLEYCCEDLEMNKATASKAATTRRRILRNEEESEAVSDPVDDASSWARSTFCDGTGIIPQAFCDNAMTCRNDCLGCVIGDAIDDCTDLPRGAMLPRRPEEEKDDKPERDSQQEERRVLPSIENSVLVQHIDQNSRAANRKAELEELRKKNLAKLNAASIDDSSQPMDRGSFEECVRKIQIDQKRNEKSAMEFLHRYRADDKNVLHGLRGDESPRTGISLLSPSYTTLSEVERFFISQRKPKPMISRESANIGEVDDQTDQSCLSTHLNSSYSTLESESRNIDIRELSIDAEVDVAGLRDSLGGKLKTSVGMPLPETPNINQMPVRTCVDSRVRLSIRQQVGHVNYADSVSSSSTLSSTDEGDSSDTSVYTTGGEVCHLLPLPVEESSIPRRRKSISKERTDPSPTQEKAIASSFKAKPPSFKAKLPSPEAEPSKTKLPSPKANSRESFTKTSSIQSKGQTTGATTAKPASPATRPISPKTKPTPPNITPKLTLKRVALYARKSSQPKHKPPCCTMKYIPNLHDSRQGCERCLHCASLEEKEQFHQKGRHLRIMVVRGGCDRGCAIFPRECDEHPVRLCKKCFHDTHKSSDDKHYGLD